jgi:hypothetical protein
VVCGVCLIELAFSGLAGPRWSLEAYDASVKARLFSIFFWTAILFECRYSRYNQLSEPGLSLGYSCRPLMVVVMCLALVKFVVASVILQRLRLLLLGRSKPGILHGEADCADDLLVSCRCSVVIPK